MWDIFNTSKFAKQFIPMRRIRKNKRVKPKKANSTEIYATFACHEKGN